MEISNGVIIERDNGMDAGPYLGIFRPLAQYLWRPFPTHFFLIP